MKIVIPIALALLLSACSEDNKSSLKIGTATKVATQKVDVVEKKAEAEAVIEEVTTVTVVRSGRSIYTACSACHGQNAEKVALGKSKVMKGWDSAKIEDALNGYKNGTYGGAMKGLMKGQVSNLSDEEIKKVSDYISKL